MMQRMADKGWIGPRRSLGKVGGRRGNSFLRWKLNQPKKKMRRFLFIDHSTGVFTRVTQVVIFYHIGRRRQNQVPRHECPYLIKTFCFVLKQSCFVFGAFCFGLSIISIFHGTFLFVQRVISILNIFSDHFIVLQRIFIVMC